MSKIKFKLNRRGVRDLLNGNSMKALIGGKANEIASRAGAGYASNTHYSGQRIIGTAYAETDEAKRDNLKNNTLLKAVR